MKYRITPGNLFCIFILSVSFFSNMLPFADAHDRLGVSYVFFFSIFIFIGDAFLQFFITNYKTLLIVESIGLDTVLLLGLIS